MKRKRLSAKARAQIIAAQKRRWEKVAKPTKTQKCMRSVGTALKGYVLLGGAIRLLEVAGKNKNVQKHVLNQILPRGRHMTNDVSHDVEYSAFSLHKTAHALCTKNAKRMWSFITQAKTALRKNDPDLAKKKLDAAATEASKCAATNLEFCLPMKAARKKELTALVQKKGK